MALKESLVALYLKLSIKFVVQFGFHWKDVSLNNILEYLYSLRDSSSLGLTRMLFGLLMLIDITEERGGPSMDDRWGHTTICHFPLFPWLKPIPMPYMALVYAALWIGALGIMLGFKYRAASVTYAVSYWYLLLIEKSYWNNHSYLFGLLALLLACSDANCCLSVDTLLDPHKFKPRIPYWNYFVLKYQLFILYFMAGVKKGTAEWLTGYSVRDLGTHWVFGPFKLFLTEPQIDTLVVHWFVFLFDLTIAFWMMYSRTRNVAVFFCAMFHLMNIRLFKIGMFPWVCLATLPLFYPFDWFKVYIQNSSWFQYLKNEIYKIKAVLWEPEPCDCLIRDMHQVETYFDKIENEDRVMLEAYRKERITAEVNGEEFRETEEPAYYEEMFKELDEQRSPKPSRFKQKLTLCFITFYMVTQAFLPFSHFITKGYNTWTNGLYGYSWDMMVHTWEINTVYVTIDDRTYNNTYLIDPIHFTPNDRWATYGDMAHQFAACLKDVVDVQNKANSKPVLSQNISIYIDVWCSMNGRFSQRVFDNHADMLRVEWSPFKPMTYVMPLLDEATSWRETIDRIKQNVYSYNNKSDVVFQADFPGYHQVKYVGSDVTNVTLTVLKGTVAYETLDKPEGYSYKLVPGDIFHVELDAKHKILVIGDTPAYYMYIFYNTTEYTRNAKRPRSKLPVLKEIYQRLRSASKFVYLMWDSIAEIIFNVSQFTINVLMTKVVHFLLDYYL